MASIWHDKQIIFEASGRDKTVKLASCVSHKFEYYINQNFDITRHSAHNLRLKSVLSDTDIVVRPYLFLVRKVNEIFHDLIRTISDKLGKFQAGHTRHE